MFFSLHRMRKYLMLTCPTRDNLGNVDIGDVNLKLLVKVMFIAF